jgi:uncharacterized protein
MPRITHFEIHAEDPERAIAFYKGVFGWEFAAWAGPMPYWLITTGPDSEPGINGGLVPRRGPIDGTAVVAFVCSLTVPSVDESVASALAHGGSIALPKMPIPGVGWLAYCKDTEGNIFGVMQNDPSAT